LNGQTNTVAFENLRVVVKSTSDFILPILFQVVIIVSILVALATIVIVLLMSHRISGPLYGLTLQLRNLKQGDFSNPIRIRASDQLQQVAEEMEAFRADLQRTVRTCKDCLEVADKISRKASQGVPKPDEWKAVQTQIEQLKTQLDPIKTA
jgi:signal transduction histidine kinase